MKFSQLQYLSILPFDLRLQVVKYWLKRTFGLSYTQAEDDLDQYLQHLLTNHGTLEEYSGDHFKAAYDLDWGKLKVFLRKSPSRDFTFFRQIIEKQLFKPICDLIESHTSLSSILRIIDAGAGIGFSSLYFSQKFPQADIICLEPIGEIYAQMLKNLSINPTEHLIPLQIAIWNNDKDLEIIKGKDFDSELIRAKDFDLEHPFTLRETLQPTGVKGLKVETLLKQRNWETLDLLKLDIEGSEMPIFDDSTSANLLLEKVRFVVMNIYDEFGIRNRIYKIFEENGFQLTEKGQMLIGVNTHLLDKPPGRNS